MNKPGFCKTTTPVKPCRNARIHLLEAKLQLQRHRRQVLGGARAVEIARIIAEVDRLCLAVEELSRPESGALL